MLTLQLNASYEPMRVIPWQDAIGMWLKGTVEIVAEYAQRVYREIEGWSGRMPAVVRLKKYVSAFKHKVKFSRRNVFGRDNYTCLYCGAQPGTEELTYDHVLPRSRGGKTNWENIATCCWDCNEKKADRTPEEAGMKLQYLPYKPKTRPRIGLSLDKPNTPEEWRDFLYWEQELET